MANLRAPPPSAAAVRRHLRAWLRALHRDVGYLLVGLTFVYALSGLAVNHIADWDPSFVGYERTVELGPLSGADGEIAAAVARALRIAGAPDEIYRAAPDQLDIRYAERTLHVDPQTGRVVDQGQRPRFFLRVANWLHTNRGKKAWTYVADSYAVALLAAATSGLFMIRGRKGLFGRGAVLVLAGIAVPLGYLMLAGGP
jgi:hypothetical protein